MAGIQVGGLASGMDAESIITQLMSIEQVPRNRAARQQVTVQARQDALRAIDTKLTNLKLAAGDLRSAALWSPTQSIASGNEGVLTARQLTGAAPGGYSGQRHVAGQRGLAHLSVDRRRGQPHRGLQGRRRPASKTFDLTGKTLDDAVSTINSDDTLARVGGQRRRELSLSRREPATTPPGASTPPGRPGRSTGLARRLQRGVHVTGNATTYSSHTNVASDGLPGSS